MNNLDFTYFEEVADKDSEFLVKVVQNIILELPFAYTSLLQSYNVNDYENTRKIIHKLKPTFDIFGVENGILISLEKNNTSDNFNFIKFQFENLILNLVEALTEKLNFYKSEVKV